METGAHALLTEWESFYVIVGSSAGALTGLMFVVITLAGDTDLPRTPDTVNAFATPNVIHFVAVLLLSALLSAPWRRMQDPAHLVGATALAGVIYVVVVARRMFRQKGYTPVLEDWIWHLLLAHNRVRGLVLRRRRPVARPAVGDVPDRWGQPAPGLHRHSQRLGHGDVHRR